MCLPSKPADGGTHTIAVGILMEKSRKECGSVSDLQDRSIEKWVLEGSSSSTKMITMVMRK